MEGEDDEDDVWDEKSLKQFKRKLQNSTFRREKSSTLPLKNAKSKRLNNNLSETRQSSHLEASQATSQDNSKESEARGNARKGKQKRKRSESASGRSEFVENEDSRTTHQRRRLNQGSSPVSNDEVTPQKGMIEGCCPKCQMPFTALIGQSPGWHVRECLETNYSFVGMPQLYRVTYEIVEAQFLVLSSCTGTQDPKQMTKQYITANQ